MSRIITMTTWCMWECSLISLVVYCNVKPMIFGKKCDNKEWDVKWELAFLGSQDIREGVALRRLILQSLECNSHFQIASPMPLTTSSTHSLGCWKCKCKQPQILVTLLTFSLKFALSSCEWRLMPFESTYESLCEMHHFFGMQKL